MALLARRGVCCDVCPTSNVLLNVAGCGSLAEHPLPRLLAAGVPCSINCDDSLLFGPSIADEYRSAREAVGLSDAALAGCARASIEHSALAVRAARGIPDPATDQVHGWLAGVDAWARAAGGGAHSRI